MIYLIISTISLAMMVAVYRLVLSNSADHRFNRFVLLTSLALAALLPLVHFDMRNAEQTGVVNNILDEISVFASGPSAQISQPELQTHLGLVDWLWIIYMTGVVICLIRVVIGIIRSEMICRSRGCTLEDGSRLVITDRNCSPFSWRNTIVMSRRDYENSADVIITHELAHIHLHHTADMIISQVFCAMQWFNPAAWMLKHSLIEVHEFEADATVLGMGVDVKRYQICLLRSALQGRYAVTVNSFADCFTKKRIVMLKKSYSSPWVRLRALLILPVVAFTILLSSSVKAEEVDNGQMPGVGVNKEGVLTVNGKEIGKKPVEEQNAEDTAPMPEVNKSITEELKVDEAKTPDEDEAFMVIEDMPEFPGGTMGMLGYLTANIKYPAECREKNIQGRVLVSFVIDKDGYIVEPEVVKSVDPLLDAEALRVVNAMPAWTPGMQKGKPVRVKYTVPINFRLSEDQPAE